MAAWAVVTSEAGPPQIALPPEIVDAIERSINSPTKTYRYVLPTQLSSKSANPALDARSIQAKWGQPGAFDARTVCQDMVVEFDRDHHNVLGGSAEPYANNPLRIPAIILKARAAQRNPKGFDDLILVLDYAEQHPDHVDELLLATAVAINTRLATAHVVYPVPNRVSFGAAVQAVNEFSSAKTGGIRLQAIAAALMQAIGTHFRLFDRVVSYNINAADASTGSAADLECGSGGEDDFKAVSAVEVKDRPLTIGHTQDKLAALRAKGIREMIYLIRGGVLAADRQAIADLIHKEFATGQNLYVTEFSEFLRVTLIQLGELGRRTFLENIGRELDERKADLSHRIKWRELLAKM